MNGRQVDAQRFARANRPTAYALPISALYGQSARQCGPIQCSQGTERIVPPAMRTATRFTPNRNWFWRGDKGAKSKERK